MEGPSRHGIVGVDRLEFTDNRTRELCPTPTLCAWGRQLQPGFLGGFRGPALNVMSNMLW